LPITAEARDGPEKAEPVERLLDAVLGDAHRVCDRQLARVVPQQRVKEPGHRAAQALAIARRRLGGRRTSLRGQGKTEQCCENW
jgi:hypothetical protein